ncbi:MAG: hypothetical protein ACM3VT_12060 [Solirubrobacterales bacterium]
MRRIVSVCLLVTVTAGAAAVARRLGSRPDPQRVEFLHAASPLEVAVKRAASGGPKWVAPGEKLESIVPQA